MDQNLNWPVFSNCLSILSVHSDHVEVIEAVRRAINPQMALRDATDDQIVVLEPLSEGSYGKVWVRIGVIPVRTV